MDSKGRPDKAAQTSVQGVEQTDLATLVAHREALDATTPLSDVYRWFQGHPHEYCAVLEGDRLLGVCSRGGVGFLMGHRYGFSIYSRQPVREHLVAHPACVQHGAPVRQVLETVLNREGDEFYQDVILIGGAGEYLGIIPIPALVRLQTKLVSEKFRLLETLHEDMIVTSRQAGMAEVATGVLHNVGNVLNSVNVSAGLIEDRLRDSKVTNVGRLSRLLREQEGNLGWFLTEDTRGRSVPAFVEQLAAHLEAERDELQEEVAGLARNIQHIKEIVTLQQNYARAVGVVDTVDLAEIIEHALSIESESYARHQIAVCREHEPTPLVQVDKHKVMMILVNLLSNAKHACIAARLEDRQVAIRLQPASDQRVAIEVADNGVGIAPEHLTRVFSHGFTTRKDGHGFGLHSGALAAKELGGSLTGCSDGPGTGAVFRLELPLAPPLDSPAKPGRPSRKPAMERGRVVEYFAAPRVNRGNALTVAAGVLVS